MSKNMKQLPPKPGSFDGLTNESIVRILGGMPMTAAQLRQVRLNQPQLSWEEQEAQFRRNWEALTANSYAVSSGNNSSNGRGNTNVSQPQKLGRKPVVGCFREAIG